MVCKRRVSPQEKKIRSYQRDGRNMYGQSTGGSRRGVRRRKQLVNKANRRAASQALDHADPVVAEAATDTIGPKRWQKSPDAPLVEWVVRQRGLRAEVPPIDSGLLREAERRLGRSKRGHLDMG
ncbi:MAG TPA: hypothetical protein VGJ86_25925 [Acidimicrobiales bacterium]|jgi:hypothetical protein